MSQAGAVAVLQEVVCVFAVLQCFSQRTPHAAEPLHVPVATTVAGDCQGGGRLDPHLEVLTGSDNMAEGGECITGPRG